MADRNQPGKRKRNESDNDGEDDAIIHPGNSGVAKKSKTSSKQGSYDQQDDVGGVDLEALGQDALAELLASAPEQEAINQEGVKKLLLNFEKAYTENTKMRTKFLGQPEKFIESEVALDSSLQALQAIATAPDLYVEIIRFGTHESLLSLLSHENADIAIDAISVLKDFLEADDATEISPEERDLASQVIKIFTQELIKGQILESSTQCLTRFDENVNEEKAGVFAILELLENIFEISLEDSCKIIVSKTSFIKWLLRRIVDPKFENETFDEIKLYCTELLHILAQSHQDVQVQIGKLNGIDLLLQYLAKWRKKSPSGSDQKEIIENIFNVLCTTATHPDNRSIFLASEGLELLKLIIKSNQYCAIGASKLLNFVLTNHLAASERWLSIGGLGTLFSSFGIVSKSTSKDENKKKSSKSAHERIEEEKEQVEHLIACISALLTNFKDAIAELLLLQQQVQADETIKSDDQANVMGRVEELSGYIQRIVFKFAESNCEKLQALIDLHEKYLHKVKESDEKRAREDNEDDGRGEDEEMEIYEDRLESGLFTLQMVDFILAFVSNSLPLLKQKSSEILKSKGLKWTDVKLTLMEFALSTANAAGYDLSLESSKSESPPINQLFESESEYLKGLAETIEVDGEN